MRAVKIWLGAVLLLCAAMLTLVHVPALAQSAAWTKCVNATTTNPDWAACGAAEVARQETRLNAAWGKAMQCFDSKDETENHARLGLIAEEKSWIAFKDGACQFYYPSGPGDSPQGYAGREGQVLSAPVCQATIVSDRARWLEEFAKDCR